MCLCALHTYSYHIYVYRIYIYIIYILYIYYIYIITYKYIQYNIIYTVDLCFLSHWYMYADGDHLIPGDGVCKHPMFLRILGQLATLNIHFCWFLCHGLFLEDPAKEITSRTVSWVWIRRLMPTPLHSTIGIAATTPIHICANQMIATQPPPLKHKSPWPQFSAQESFCLVYWDCSKTNVHIATLVPKKVATSPYVAESSIGAEKSHWDQREISDWKTHHVHEFPPLIQTCFGQHVLNMSYNIICCLQLCWLSYAFVPFHLLPFNRTSLGSVAARHHWSINFEGLWHYGTMGQHRRPPNGDSSNWLVGEPMTGPSWISEHCSANLIRKKCQLGKIWKNDMKRKKKRSSGPPVHN